MTLNFDKGGSIRTCKYSLACDEGDGVIFSMSGGDWFDFSASSGSITIFIDANNDGVQRSGYIDAIINGRERCREIIKIIQAG